MSTSEPTPRLIGTAEIMAELQAQIDRDEAEIAAELGETPPAPIDDELASRRAKRGQISPRTRLRPDG